MPADLVCLSSAILVEPTSVKTIPELLRPAFWVLQRTGDVESVDPDKFWPGDSKAVRNGQIGMATTRGDGYVSYLTRSRERERETLHQYAG